jgi:hypothetical protein
MDGFDSILFRPSYLASLIFEIRYRSLGFASLCVFCAFALKNFDYLHPNCRIATAFAAA